MTTIIICGEIIIKYINVIMIIMKINKYSILRTIIRMSKKLAKLSRNENSLLNQPSIPWLCLIADF